jgi:hypothetical protein
VRHNPGRRPDHPGHEGFAMPKYWLLLSSFILGGAALFVCWNNQETHAESAANSCFSEVEERVREHITKTAANPDSVEFLQWEPHAEEDGFYRCRYSALDEQGQLRVYDDWFFAPKGSTAAVRVTTPHLTRKDREEFKKSLNSLAAELEKVTSERQ